MVRLAITLVASFLIGAVASTVVINVYMLTQKGLAAQNRAIDWWAITWVAIWFGSWIVMLTVWPGRPRRRKNV